MAIPLPTVHAASVSALAAAAGVPEVVVAPPAAISVGPHGFLVGPASISYDVGLDSISAANARVRSELQLAYDQLRQQGQGWYRLSTASAAIGFGIIAVAVVALLLGNVTTGIVSTVASIVPNAIASIFFVQARQADKRLDGITQELAKSREAYVLLDIANTTAQSIDDPRLRNEVKAEIVRKVLAK